MKTDKDKNFETDRNVYYITTFKKIKAFYNKLKSNSIQVIVTKEAYNKYINKRNLKKKKNR